MKERAKQLFAVKKEMDEHSFDWGPIDEPLEETFKYLIYYLESTETALGAGLRGTPPLVECALLIFVLWLEAGLR